MLKSAMIRRPCCLVVVLLSLWGGASIGAEKAAVFGTPTANIRSGPGVEHPIKANLKEGDIVAIDKLEGEWYLVTAADGQKGYIHKNLLKVAEEMQKPAVLPVKATEGAAKEPGKAASLPAATVTAAPQKAPAPVSELASVPAVPPTPATKTPAPVDVKSTPVPAKSSALIQLIEGRETETLICLAVAVLAFLMGWICGGIYSLRRDRLKRSRLIF